MSNHPPPPIHQRNTPFVILSQGMSSKFSTKSILWILNGCGLEGLSITGGPVRFHEVSSRFAGFGFRQHLLTTSGGKVMQTALGCDLPMTIVPASLLLRREPYRLFRF